MSTEQEQEQGPCLWDFAREAAGPSAPPPPVSWKSQKPEYYKAKGLNKLASDIEGAISWSYLPGGFSVWSAICATLRDCEAYGNGAIGSIPDRGLRVDR